MSDRTLNLVHRLSKTRSVSLGGARPRRMRAVRLLGVCTSGGDVGRFEGQCACTGWDISDVLYETDIWGYVTVIILSDTYT